MSFVNKRWAQVFNAAITFELFGLLVLTFIINFFTFQVLLSMLAVKNTTSAYLSYTMYKRRREETRISSEESEAGHQRRGFSIAPPNSSFKVLSPAEKDEGGTIFSKFPKVEVGRNYQAYTSKYEASPPYLLYAELQVKGAAVTLCFPFRTYAIIQVIYGREGFYKNPKRNVDKEYKKFIRSAKSVSEFIKFQRLHEGDQEDEECAICKEVYCPADVLQVLPSCRHYFHYECIKEWVQKGGPDCPICRADFGKYMESFLCGLQDVFTTLNKYGSLDQAEVRFWKQVQLSSTEKQYHHKKFRFKFFKTKSRACKEIFNSTIKSIT